MHVARLDISMIAVTLTAPAVLNAQAPKASQALAVPVESIGSCSAAIRKPMFLMSAPGLRGVQVVIAADQPSQRREVSLFVNRRGQPAELDAVNYGATMAGGAGEDAVWAKDASGSVQAFRLRHTAMPGGGVRHQRLKLSASEWKNVQSMIAWMSARCGALLRTE